MNRTMHILITGGGLHNKGAEAMLLTARDAMKERLGTVEFHVISQSETERRRLAEIGFQCPAIGSLMSGRLDISIIQRVIARRITDSPAPPAEGRLLEGIDAVLDVGGFVNSDIFGPVAALVREMFFAQAYRLGLPVVFLSQSWGPFRRASVRYLTRRMLNRATLTIARDDESYRHLSGLDLKTPFQQAPDVAFGFKGDGDDVADELLRQAGVSVGGAPLVAIVPNRQMVRRTSGDDVQNQYIQLLGRLARQLSQSGAKVVIIAHHIMPGQEHRDDRQLCGWVKRAAAIGGLTVLDGDYSASQLKAIVGRMDFVLASRFHGIIAAFSKRVPCVGLGWSHKYRELFASVGLDDCQVSLKDLDGDEVAKLIAKLWDDRKRIAAKLVQMVPHLESASSEAMDRAAELLMRRLGS